MTEYDVKVIRTKMVELEKNQRILAQVAKEILSILNMTQLEMSSNRASIYWSINCLWELRQDVTNNLEAVSAELQELSCFVQQ